MFIGVKESVPRGTHVTLNRCTTHHHLSNLNTKLKNQSITLYAITNTL